MSDLISPRIVASWVRFVTVPLPRLEPSLSLIRATLRTSPDLGMPRSITPDYIPTVPPDFIASYFNALLNPNTPTTTRDSLISSVETYRSRFTDLYNLVANWRNRMTRLIDIGPYNPPDRIRNEICRMLNLPVLHGFRPAFALTPGSLVFPGPYDRPLAANFIPTNLADHIGTCLREFKSFYGSRATVTPTTIALSFPDGVSVSHPEVFGNAVYKSPPFSLVISQTLNGYSSPGGVLIPFLRPHRFTATLYQDNGNPPGVRMRPVDFQTLPHENNADWCIHPHAKLTYLHDGSQYPKRTNRYATICLGEGSLGVTRSFKCLDLVAGFELLTSILNTYNPASPYSYLTYYIKPEDRPPPIFSACPTCAQPIHSHENVHLSPAGLLCPACWQSFLTTRRPPIFERLTRDVTPVRPPTPAAAPVPEPTLVAPDAPDEPEPAPAPRRSRRSRIRFEPVIADRIEPLLADQPRPEPPTANVELQF